MANDPKAAAAWAEAQAAKGEPSQTDDTFVCPNTGTKDCDDGEGCKRC